MSEPEEIELKLEVSADRIDRLDSLSLLKGVTPNKSKTLLSVYFDTAQQTLRNNGLSLRVRRVDDHYVQTIKKRDNRGAGLFERNEWECAIPNGRPDLHAAKNTPLTFLLSRKLRRSLKPLIETRVQRRSYSIRKNDSEIELTVDKGKVEAAGRSSPLCEVELELKKGKPADLFAFAHALGKFLPVTAASKSKADRGYDLLAKNGPGPVKSEPIALNPEVTWATAFRVIAQACLYQIAANQDLVRRGDAEGAHQMRIGIRRLRTAIALFEDILPDTQVQAIKADLKWLTGELAPARELDVFIKRVVKRAKGSNTDGPTLDAVAADFRKRREHALGKAAETVTSPHFRRLVLDAAEWIAVGEWTQNNEELSCSMRQRPVVGAAAEELSRRLKKIRRQGRHLVELDPEHLHKLRIRAKKLRYAAEFFAGVFPSRKSARRREKFVLKLEAMQDALGEINDIRVDEKLMRKMCRDHVRKAFVVGRLTGREDARFPTVIEDAERAFARFNEARPFWL